MAKKQFLAQWRDQNGRHRKYFNTQAEADELKFRMVALREAAKLGIAIAAGAAKGAGRVEDVHRLTRKCSKIAHMKALELSIEQPAQISA